MTRNPFLSISTLLYGAFLAVSLAAFLLTLNFAGSRPEPDTWSAPFADPAAGRTIAPPALMEAVRANAGTDTARAPR